jgi:hypothetical protein
MISSSRKWSSIVPHRSEPRRINPLRDLQQVLIAGEPWCVMNPKGAFSMLPRDSRGFQTMMPVLALSPHFLQRLVRRHRSPLEIRQRRFGRGSRYHVVVSVVHISSTSPSKPPTTRPQTTLRPRQPSPPESSPSAPPPWEQKETGLRAGRQANVTPRATPFDAQAARCPERCLGNAPHKRRLEPPLIPNRTPPASSTSRC